MFKKSAIQKMKVEIKKAGFSFKNILLIFFFGINIIHFNPNVIFGSQKNGGI